MRVLNLRSPDKPRWSREMATMECADGSQVTPWKAAGQAE